MTRFTPWQGLPASLVLAPIELLSQQWAPICVFPALATRDWAG
jgi:hypothetical protein